MRILICLTHMSDLQLVRKGEVQRMDVRKNFGLSYNFTEKCLGDSVNFAFL